MDRWTDRLTDSQTSILGSRAVYLTYVSHQDIICILGLISFLQNRGRDLIMPCTCAVQAHLHARMHARAHAATLYYTGGGWAQVGVTLNAENWEKEQQFFEYYQQVARTI